MIKFDYFFIAFLYSIWSDLVQKCRSKSIINLIAFRLLWRPLVITVLKFIRLKFTEDIPTRQTSNAYFEETQLKMEFNRKLKEFNRKLKEAEGVI